MHGAAHGQHSLRQHVCCRSEAMRWDHIRGMQQGPASSEVVNSVDALVMALQREVGGRLPYAPHLLGTVRRQSCCRWLVPSSTPGTSCNPSNAGCLDDPMFSVHAVLMQICTTAAASTRLRGHLHSFVEGRAGKCVRVLGVEDDLHRPGSDPAQQPGSRHTAGQSQGPACMT